MIFTRDDIPSRMLTKHVFPDDIAGLFISITWTRPLICTATMIKIY